MSEAAVERRMVRTRHGWMHVRVVGDAPGPPVLLVHSQLVSGIWYDDMVPLLAPERRLVIPDRIGYGCSDPAPRKLGFAEYAEATVDVLDDLGIAQCDAVGIHSGGIEVVELATSHASRIRRAAIATVAVFTDEEVRLFREQYIAPPPEPVEDGSHLGFYWGWWAGIKPPGVSLARAQRWLVDHLIASPNYWWTFDAAFDYPMAERVGRIAQPLLVLAPHDDLWVQMERALPLLPAQTEVVDLPHVTNAMGVFTDHVEECARHIRRFLG